MSARAWFASTSLLALASCASGSMQLDVALPSGVRAGDVALSASVYSLAPSGEVSCDDVAFRVLTEDALAPSLISTTQLVGEGSLGDVPRFGTKLVLVTGTKRADPTLRVVEGCAVAGDVVDSVTVNVTLERTVQASLRPEAPAQLVVGPGDDEGDALALLVTDAFDGKPRSGVDVDVRVGLNVDADVERVQAKDGGRLDVVVTPPSRGPFQVSAQPRLGVGPAVVVVGFALPTPTVLAEFGGTASELAVLHDDDDGAAFAAIVSTGASGGGRTEVHFADPSGDVVKAGGDAGLGVAGGLAVVGRARFVASAPSSLLVYDGVAGELLAVDDAGIAMSAPDPIAGFFAGVHVIPIGPCDGDPDAGPVLALPRAGASAIAVVGADVDGGGAASMAVRVHPTGGSSTPLASVCAGSPAVRWLVVRDRVVGLNVVQVPSDAFASVDAADELPFADLQPLPADLVGGLAYGSSTRDGGLVVARIDEVQVRVDHIDLQDRLAVADGMVLPGPPLLVGAADLFGDGAQRLFALVSLETGDLGGEAPAILVVQGADGVVASAPLPLCLPAASCDIIAADVDKDGTDDLVIAHRTATAGVDGDVPRAEIWHLR